jgi:hypothetical protein
MDDGIYDINNIMNNISLINEMVIDGELIIMRIIEEELISIKFDNPMKVNFELSHMTLLSLGVYRELKQIINSYPNKQFLLCSESDNETVKALYQDTAYYLSKRLGMSKRCIDNGYVLTSRKNKIEN